MLLMQRDLYHIEFDQRENISIYEVKYRAIKDCISTKFFNLDLTRILSNDGERGGIMKQKYLLWFASVATVVMIIIALACNLTQFNDDNKSPKALLPANEMISDCLEEYTVEWYSEISSIMINNDDLLKKDVVQEYIIANSLSFQGIEHINIKVFGDETGEMTYKFYNSEFENEGEMKVK